jgi:asparagine synthase (glutamine-hydrolysing)
MSGLCGWIRAGGATGQAGPEAIARMAAEITRFDGSKARSETAGFGSVTVSSLGGDADVYKTDAQLVAVWGRMHFANADLAALAQQHGTARALAQGYASEGEEVLPAVQGAFALAILDGSRGEAMLAIDRMGTRPLCYGVVGDAFVFGSTLDSISAFQATAPSLNAQAVYDYVYFHMVPAPDTIHAGRHRLLPGAFLHWRNGKIETRPYWEMRFVEEETRPFPELKQDFLAALREGVREAARDGNVGSFLSGGTDSSTVAGMLGEITGQPARTYSIGFDVRGYDEMEYARIAARHFGTRHHEYYVTPDDVVNAIPQIAAVHDQPFGNSSAVPTFYCAKLAKDDGIDTLLGGDGGDELFGGNERYAKQYLYSLYSDLPRGARKGVIEPIVGLLPSFGITGKAQRYILHASEPMPARYDNYNLLERVGPEVVFTREFLDQVDRALPVEQRAQAYNSAHASSLINRMLALDLKYTLADNDLPKVCRSCELARVEVRFPMLNDALVAFSARLAPDLKLKGARLRYFFKEALRGFLPDEIIAKTKHGFGLPFGQWLQTHKPLQQLVGDSLQELKGRGIVQPQLVDELLAELVQSHAGYYGTLAWVLMMLEQWFRKHGAAP